MPVNESDVDWSAIGPDDTGFRRKQLGEAAGGDEDERALSGFFREDDDIDFEDEIGTVADVENDTAYVDLDPGLTDELKATLGFGDSDEGDTYALRDEMVGTVDDDGVHLQGTH